MKTITRLLTLTAVTLIALNSKAQVPNGSIAKDFTLTDIKGVTHNLYSYLAAGKTVYLDCSATWCGPCWSYHEAGSFKDLYNQHGPNGTMSKDLIVLFIEVDSKTSLSDLKGITSPGAQTTQGDWLTGEPYPFIDLAGPSGGQFFNDYMIKTVPTIYRICPNRKVDYLGYEVKTAAQLYAYASACSTVDIPEQDSQHQLTVYPNPSVDYATLHFNVTAENPGSVSVMNAMGQTIFTEDLGKITAGSYEYRLDVASFSNGLYFVTVRAGGSEFTQKISINR